MNSRLFILLVSRILFTRGLPNKFLRDKENFNPDVQTNVLKLFF